MMTARVITTILRLRRPTHAYIVVMTLAVIMRGHSSCGGGACIRHDDRKGHHYYTPASQAHAYVYSSDDPCGHHVTLRSSCGALIMLTSDSHSTLSHFMICSSSLSATSLSVEGRLWSRCPSRERRGEAIIVVTNAIITNMAKSVGERTPRSRPMLSTINSTSPRVFISTPRLSASRHDSPIQRTDSVLPTSLPAQATTTTSKHISHRSGL